MKLGGKKKHRSGKTIIFKCSELWTSRCLFKKTTKKENFLGGTERWDRWLLIQTEKKMPVINEESKKKNQFHICKKLHFLFRVCALLNDITNV